jgi:HAD superfamily hydrolase (TIGR01509 family)
MAKLRSVAQFGPITAVLFDFHRTLVDGGDPVAALDAAWTRTGRAGSLLTALGAGRHQALVQGVYHLWDDVRSVDPDNQRDLSPRRHRELFGELMGRVPDMDPDLAQAYYEVMPEMWMAYEDSLPTLTALKRGGARLAVVSNVARDIRPVLARGGLLHLFDTVVLSFEAGVVKPQAPIFQLALDALGAAPANALMVGDNPYDDGAAGALGVRTLILPRTEGRSHGLDAVVRIAC